MQFSCLASYLLHATRPTLPLPLLVGNLSIDKGTGILAAFNSPRPLYSASSPAHLCRVSLYLCKCKCIFWCLCCLRCCVSLEQLHLPCAFSSTLLPLSLHPLLRSISRINSTTFLVAIDLFRDIPSGPLGPKSTPQLAFDLIDSHPESDSFPEDFAAKRYKVRMDMFLYVHFEARHNMRIVKANESVSQRSKRY